MVKTTPEQVKSYHTYPLNEVIGILCTDTFFRRDFFLGPEKAYVTYNVTPDSSAKVQLGYLADTSDAKESFAQINIVCCPKPPCPPPPTSKLLLTVLGDAVLVDGFCTALFDLGPREAVLSGDYELSYQDIEYPDTAILNQIFAEQRRSSLLPRFLALHDMLVHVGAV